MCEWGVTPGGKTVSCSHKHSGKEILNYNFYALEKE